MTTERIDEITNKAEKIIRDNHDMIEVGRAELKELIQSLSEEERDEFLMYAFGKLVQERKMVGFLKAFVSGVEDGD